MATDATGTPTSPDNIPTYNTAGDPPSGKGFNAAMALIQTALSKRLNIGTLFTTAGDLAYASGAGAAARLGIGSSGQVLTVAGGVPSWATPAGGSMALITDSLLGGTQAQWNTATLLGGNLPTTYKHLRLYLNVRGSAAAAACETYLLFNNDNTNNYEYQARYSAATGTSSVFANNPFSVISLTANTTPSATGTANRAATMIVDIPDYNSATFAKMCHWSAHGQDGTTLYSINGAGQYGPNGAITSIQVSLSAGSMVAGSRFTLYGIN